MNIPIGKIFKALGKFLLRDALDLFKINPTGKSPRQYEVSDQRTSEHRDLPPVANDSSSGPAVAQDEDSVGENGLPYVARGRVMQSVGPPVPGARVR